MSTKVVYIICAYALFGALSVNALENSHTKEKFDRIAHVQKSVLKTLQQQYNLLQELYEQELRSAVKLKQSIIISRFASASKALLLEEEQELLKARLKRLRNAMEEIRRTFEHVRAQLFVSEKKYNNGTLNRRDDEVQNNLD